MNENDEILKTTMEWRWALVGNIVLEHEFGDNQVIRLGTKHFAPGAKVYCGKEYAGDGYENVVVIGKQRNSSKYIELVMSRFLIENFRLQKVYKPLILNKMANSKKHSYWENKDEDREELLSMLTWLNPYYKIQTNDVVTSINSLSDELLREEILKGEFSIKKIEPKADYLSSEYTEACISEIENSVDKWKCFDWIGNHTDLANKCAHYIGNYIIHHIGGEWFSLKNKPIVILKNDYCCFPFEMLTSFYWHNKHRIVDSITTLMKMHKESVL